MDDVLRYAGKRVIVTGASSGVGKETARILVDLGAEVHTIGLQKPDVSGLASFTEADLRDPDQIDAGVKKIGAIVDALFNCAHAPNPSSTLDVLLVGFCGLRHLTERVVPLMIDGSAVVHVTSAPMPAAPGAADGLLETSDVRSAHAWCESHAETVDEADAFTSRAVSDYTRREGLGSRRSHRMNCVNVGVPHPPEPHAWTLVYLNSPRASALSGVAIEM